MRYIKFRILSAKVRHDRYMGTMNQSVSSRPRVKQARPKKGRVHRTTVSLSSEAVDAVERFKAATGASTSHAIEELILRNEPQKSWLVEVDGFPMLNAPLKGGQITSDDVKRMLEECPW